MPLDILLPGDEGTPPGKAKGIEISHRKKELAKKMCVLHRMLRNFRQTPVVSLLFLILTVILGS